MSKYKKLIIFSGTSEGRNLSEELAVRGIYHTVCVATDYGELMQPKNEYTFVNEGRLTEAQMVELFDDDSVIVDATHPYATEVTLNIKKAAATKGCEYLRLVRDTLTGQVTGDKCRYFEDYESMASAINELDGNILITTGSKELAKLCSIVQDTTRLYVRVLPSLESLSLCEQAGIRNDHIIAMHGPFSEEMNVAMLRQYNISCLVTKESGARGGYPEKIRAAESVGATCLICGRPSDEVGLTGEEVLRYLTRISTIEESKVDMQSYRQLIVNVVGIGMGNPDCMTVGASKAIANSDIVFGASRLIEGIEGEKYPYYLARDIIPVIEDRLEFKICEVKDKATGGLHNACSKASRNLLTVSVLYSGDISFFSGANKFVDELNEWAKSYEVEVRSYPGISSVSYLAAKIGRSYSDTPILSLHGRSDEANVTNIANMIIESGRAFVLLSSGYDVAKLAGKIKSVGNIGREYRFIVGSRLSYTDEEIIELSIEEASMFSGKGLYIAYVSECSKL